MTRASDAAVRPVRIQAPDVCVERRPSGAWYARSPHPLGPYPRALTSRLDHWADRTPDRPFLAERDTSGAWRVVTFEQARASVRSIAQALLARRLSPDRPIAILSGNSVDHALLALGAMVIGRPYAPIAPSYSLAAQDHVTLRAIWASLDPQAVFVEDPARYSRALDAVMRPDIELISSAVGHDTPQAATPFSTLTATPVTAGVDEAAARVGPDTIAKILFTSGSTGSPKGVINTQRMLCANQQMICESMPFLADDPPVLCDWLPWNHTFGGNHNVGIALYNGGSLYIDHGRPMSGAFDTTLANLREIATTAYFNVPRGYEMLLPALRSDTPFRTHFFSRLRMLFYAAAGLRQRVADEIDELAIEACGERIAWVTGLGSTESAPFALCTGAQMTSTNKVGVPVPGVELKLAPVGDRLEARLRGPNITPGYWRNDALTRAAFDEEGYYCMGDALAFVDAADPAQGWMLEGRLADDFKLSTGTWVRVGPLRARFLAQAGDLVQDVVVAGEGRDCVAALVLPGLAACRRLAGDDTCALSPAQLCAHPSVVARFAGLLADFSAAHPGSSTALTRAILLDEPPSIDAQEITDKGSLNQRAVLRRRALLVDELYGEPGSPRVIDSSKGLT
jgi:feruloyl-CoA synthase